MKSSISPVKKRVGFGVYPTQKIELSIKNKRKDFLSFFTSHEKAYCGKKKRAVESFAARMAAKCAFWDAVGILKPLEKYQPKDWRKIEVGRKKQGPPSLRIANSLKKKFNIPSNANILVSLTHERAFAMAAVIIES